MLPWKPGQILVCVGIYFLVLVVTASFRVGHHPGKLDFSVFFCIWDFSVLFWQLLVESYHFKLKVKGKKKAFQAKGPFQQNLESKIRRPVRWVKPQSYRRSCVAGSLSGNSPDCCIKEDALSMPGTGWHRQPHRPYICLRQANWAVLL